MEAEDRAVALFETHFGRAAQWVASAPGRVNLIGEFTDYNAGFVLPMAIGRRTAIAAAQNDSNRVIVRSEAIAAALEIDLAEPLRPERQGSWTNYIRGVMAGALEAGIEVRGFDALISSTVPLGAGLSSSAALEVATATLLEAMGGRALDSGCKALLCQRSEQSFAGVPCGIMDPLISTLGRADHVLLLDCRSQACDWLPLTDPSIAILIVNTNVRHQLAGSAYAERRRTCEAAAAALGLRSLREATVTLLHGQEGATLSDDARRCATHVVAENDRTLQAARCIRESDWTTFGRLLDQSHQSLKSDFRVSCAELDAVVEAAQSIGLGGGVYGCRMTGGGFGGCAVALVDSGSIDAIIQRIRSDYCERTGNAASFLVSRPAAGAHWKSLRP